MSDTSGPSYTSHKHNLKRWTPIKYRDFYDIPRIFFAESLDRVFLFDCPFNEEKDEYEEAFRIYLLPAIGEQELAGSWKNLPQRATRLLGGVGTSEVEFDTTLRRQVNLEILRRFGF
jgi:hypothetical protein